MKKGAQVICIDDTIDPKLVSLIPNRPVKDEMYTVRETLLTRNGRAIQLEELRNPELYDELHQGMFEPSFHIRRFRIVDTEDLQLELEEHGVSTIDI
jgi:hypothetical protein